LRYCNLFCSHWIWFILPRLRGLGARLRECVAALCTHTGSSAAAADPPLYWRVYIVRILAQWVVGFGLLGFSLVLSNHLLGVDARIWDFVFNGVAVTLFTMMLMGLRRKASQDAQRLAVLASALWFFYGIYTALRYWGPSGYIPFLILFVPPSSLVMVALRDMVPWRREKRGDLVAIP